MAKNPLQKLSRAELLQLLLEAEEENESLKQQVAGLQQQLEDRRIRIEKSGDLAAAAMELNGVFAAAQAACQQYTDNIKARSEGLEAECRKMIEETEKECRARKKETMEECRRLLQEISDERRKYQNAHDREREK